MKIMLLLVSIALTVFSSALFADDQTGGLADTESTEKHPVVIIKTNLGPIIVKLDAEKAPVTVKNFLTYVRRSFYSGTIFHRVIANFMIQGGGFDTKGVRKPTKDPIECESRNGLSNTRGAIVMARTKVINSATSQFFINLVDNSNTLDYRNDSARGYGYAVFGEVIMGMEVVDRIAAVPVRKSSLSEAEPIDQVVIESIILNE